MTPSIEATCDVFLPLATAAEEDGVDFAHYGALPGDGRVHEQGHQVGECKTDMEPCMTVGKRLNPEVWEQYNDVYDFIDELRLGKKTGAYFKDVCRKCTCRTPWILQVRDAASCATTASPASTRLPGAWSCSRPCSTSSATTRCRTTWSRSSAPTARPSC
ncbi:MAG: hypothetical protein V8S24_00060 [Gordonibacter pamelaeae]